ncbi:MAG: thermosome subunit beta [Promethearchaeota archaeon]
MVVAIRESWNAVKALGRAFSSSYGPGGLDKLIFDREHDVLVVTNDGHAIARELKELTRHPVAKALLGVATRHARSRGDHAKFLVLFASFVLGEVEPLVADELVHPQVAKRALLKCKARAREATEGLRRFPTVERRSFKRAFRTALEGKFGPAVADHLAEVLASAVGSLPPSAFSEPALDLKDWFAFHGRQGGLVSETEFHRGRFALGRPPAHPRAPARLRRPVACVTTAKLYAEPPDWARRAQFQVSGGEGVETFHSLERDLAKKWAKSVRAAGVDLLLAEKGTSAAFEAELAARGALVVRRVKPEVTRALSKSLGFEVNGDPLRIEPGQLFQLERAWVERVPAPGKGGELVVWVEGPGAEGGAGGGPGPFGGTFAVRGGTRLVREEVERHLKRALGVATKAFGPREGGVVPGSGATDLFVAASLREWAATLAGKEALVVEAVAGAFEQVFATLAANVGLDPLDALLEARSELAHKGPAPVGLAWTPDRGFAVDRAQPDTAEFFHSRVAATGAALEFVAQIVGIDQQVLTNRKVHRDRPEK